MPAVSTQSTPIAAVTQCHYLLYDEYTSFTLENKAVDGYSSAIENTHFNGGH